MFSSHDYHHIDQIMSKSTGNSIFIGDICAAEDLRLLREYNIRTVITAAQGFSLKYDASIRHYKYALQDNKSENIFRYFDDAADKIQKCILSAKIGLKFGSVLVHCGAGVSRSTTLVIAYLIKYIDMTFQTALKLTKSKRPQVCPNLGFQLQLKSYSIMHQKISHKIRMSGISVDKQPIFPGIMRSRMLDTFNETSNYKPFIAKTKMMRGYSNLSKNNSSSIHPSKDINYLRKIAEFRFGVTNTGKWSIS